MELQEGFEGSRVLFDSSRRGRLACSLGLHAEFSGGTDGGVAHFFGNATQPNRLVK